MLRIIVLRSENDAKALYGFLRANWAAMAQAGRPLAVTVAEHKHKRTDDQNRKYWAMLDDISRDGWLNGKQYSKDQWHQSFAGEFIGWNELPSGKQAPISTASLSVSEFGEYIERIMQFAAEELGVILS